MKKTLLFVLIAFLFALAATNSFARHRHHHHHHFHVSNDTYTQEPEMNSTARRHHFPLHHQHTNASNASIVEEYDSRLNSTQSVEGTNSTSRRHFFPRRRGYFLHTSSSDYPVHAYDPEDSNSATRRHAYPRRQHGENAEFLGRRHKFSRQRRFVNDSFMEPDEEDTMPETNSTRVESFKDDEKRSPVNETFYE